MRLLVGVLLGFFAAGAMGLHELLSRPPADWLARVTAMAILRMYGLHAGIDEGAVALYEQWGDAGRATFKQLLENNQIPDRYQGYARLLLEYVQ